MNGLLAICNYNNEIEINDVLDDVEKNVNKEKIVVIDDASTDESRLIAEQRGVKVIFHQKNIGVGGAIRTAIQYARTNDFDYLVLMASNGKMKAKYIGALVEPIITGKVDFVQGSRYLQTDGSPGLTLFRKIIIPIYTKCVSFLLGVKLTDATCGFRAFKLSIFDNPSINLDQTWLERYELETYLLYKVSRLKYRICETAVTMDYKHLSKSRVSKIKPFSGWWSVIRPLILLPLKIKH